MKLSPEHFDRLDTAIQGMSSLCDRMDAVEKKRGKVRKDAAKLVARTTIPGGGKLKGKIKLAGSQPNHK